MYRDFAVGSPLQFRRQGLVSGKHVCEIGVAALLRGWNFQGIEYCGLGRNFDVGHIGVPHGFAVPKVADWLAVLPYVGNDIQFWMGLVERLAVGVRPRRIKLA